MSKLTYEEVKYFILNNSNAMLLSTEFKNSKTKMLFKCECGETFETNYDTFKRKNKRQCNACGIKNQIDKQSKTHEQFCNEVEKNGKGEYKVLGKYTNNHTKVEMLHIKCGKSYEVEPRKFIAGRRCPNCNQNFKYSTSEISEKVKNITNGEYELLSDYINYDTHITIKHIKCGHTWEVLPYNFFKNKATRCPKCCGREYWNTDTFSKYVEEVTNKEYEVLGEYINARSKIKILHKKCNEVWDVVPDSFLSGVRCPSCKNSHGEEIIKEYLIKNNIEFKQQFIIPECRHYKPLRFDFKINVKGKNMLIEFDGIQHFQPVKMFGGEKQFLLNKKRDKIKNEFCKKHKINLLRISYKEEEKIEENS